MPILVILFDWFKPVNLPITIMVLSGYYHYFYPALDGRKPDLSKSAVLS